MSIQSKLRELLQSRGGRDRYAGHAEAERSTKVPPPGHPTGAEGGDDSPSVDKAPGVPAGDNSPLGDTDQHSTADA